MAAFQLVSVVDIVDAHALTPAPLPKRERGDSWCKWVVPHFHEIQ